MTLLRIPVTMLGQSGCKFSFPETTLFIDPYLSNSAQVLDSPDLVRMTPIPFPPNMVTNADWILITHEHIDHCDPHTLPKIALASPQARFIGPQPVLNRLIQFGISEKRCVLATEQWASLAKNLQVRAVPAAHPNIVRDAQGNLECVGYLISYYGRNIYLAGDTFAHHEIIESLNEHAPIHTAFLPVNEHNFFRAQRGIIGNMSVHEAFQFAEAIGVRQVVPVHWDMFALNGVNPNEIRFIYEKLTPPFSLLIRPEAINLADAQVSVIIRALNEEKHLANLLQTIVNQKTNGLAHELVLVNSGSTDNTLSIAERYGCHIRHISREEFSFGRSLNIGCDAANGDIFVMISGHCLPSNDHWLQCLCQPIIDGKAEYVYGRQLGGKESYFSETRIFAKYYTEQSRIPQEGFFCNNANAAIKRSVWQKYQFDETLTGLEDMALAKKLVADGGKVAYEAEAAVFHFHYETLSQVRRRFEREAIALQQIMPQVHVNVVDTLRYIFNSIWKDFVSSKQALFWQAHAIEIIRYRWNQYFGTLQGNRNHRKLSHADKEKYFFPD